MNAGHINKLGLSLQLRQPQCFEPAKYQCNSLSKVREKIACDPHPILKQKWCIEYRSSSSRWTGFHTPLALARKHKICFDKICFDWQCFCFMQNCGNLDLNSWSLVKSGKLSCAWKAYHNCQVKLICHDFSMWVADSLRALRPNARNIYCRCEAVISA